MCSYQTQCEQPGCCVSVGQVDESQSSCCDGSPEYTVQTAGSFMTHEQRRGYSIGVDETSIGTLQAVRHSWRLAQSYDLVRECHF